MAQRLSPDELIEYQALTDYFFPLEDGWRQMANLMCSFTGFKRPKDLLPIKRFSARHYTRADAQRDVDKMNAWARMHGLKENGSS